MRTFADSITVTQPDRIGAESVMAVAESEALYERPFRIRLPGVGRAIAVYRFEGDCIADRYVHEGPSGYRKDLTRREAIELVAAAMGRQA